jgi:K(+)-stimulated pyrophosphate-energized sodium pump
VLTLRGPTALGRATRTIPLNQEPIAPMISLAAEGGYQVFTLDGAAWFWLIFSAVTALIAIAVGFYLVRGVIDADQGTPKMIEIAKAIQEGAMAYLNRQFKTIAIILVPLAIVVFVTSTEVLKPAEF